MDQNEKIFRTRTGICRVLPDRIILERKGMAGKAAATIQGDGIRRIQVIYALVAATLAVTGIIAILRGDYWQGGIALLLAGYLAWGVLGSRNLSATSEIPRSAITRVEVRRPRPPIKRGYFVIWFEENGQEVRRLILMPGSLTGGKGAFKAARDILHEADLL
jgi:hypothetical protein